MPAACPGRHRNLEPYHTRPAHLLAGDVPGLHCRGIRQAKRGAGLEPGERCLLRGRHLDWMAGHPEPERSVRGRAMLWLLLVLSKNTTAASSILSAICWAVFFFYEKT